MCLPRFLPLAQCTGTQRNGTDPQRQLLNKQTRRSTPYDNRCKQVTAHHKDPQANSTIQRPTCKACKLTTQIPSIRPQSSIKLFLQCHRSLPRLPAAAACNPECYRKPPEHRTPRSWIVSHTPHLSVDNSQAYASPARQLLR